MGAITRDIKKTAPWTLLHAVDAFLAVPDRPEIQDDFQRRKVRLQQFGQKLNILKTKYMELCIQRLSVDEPLRKATAFRYLESYITSAGSAHRDENKTS